MKASFAPLAVALFLGHMAGLGLPGPAQAQEVPLQFGLILPLSGPFEPLGRQIEAGVSRALSDAGRVEEISIVAVDDGCDEADGRDAANRLIGAGVDAVLGGVCWRPAVAARPVLADAAVPFIASAVRYPAFTDDASDARAPVLRLSGRDDRLADTLIDALTNGTLDGLIGGSARQRSLVLFHTQAASSRPLADALIDGLAARETDLALVRAFDPEADALEDLARDAEAEDADLAIVLAGQADSALLIDALHAQLPALPVLASDSVLTSEFPLLAGAGAQHVVFARPTPWRSLVREDRLMELEAGDDGAAAGLFVAGYASAQIALALMEDPDLRRFETVLGSVTFDANGDSDLPSFTLWQWNDGLIFPFDPESPRPGPVGASEDAVETP